VGQVLTTCIGPYTQLMGHRYSIKSCDCVDRHMSSMLVLKLLHHSLLLFFLNHHHCLSFHCPLWLCYPLPTHTTCVSSLLERVETWMVCAFNWHTGMCPFTFFKVLTGLLQIFFFISFRHRGTM
jgi:hypothetical protein